LQKNITKIYVLAIKTAGVPIQNTLHYFNYIKEIKILIEFE